jgi:hypothetical protein
MSIAPRIKPANPPAAAPIAAPAAALFLDVDNFMCGTISVSLLAHRNADWNYHTGVAWNHDTSISRASATYFRMLDRRA